MEENKPEEVKKEEVAKVEENVKIEATSEFKAETVEAKTKKSKKGLIFFLIILVVLAASAGAGYYLISREKGSEDIKKGWGDKYYDYLKEADSSEDKTKYGMELGATDKKIRFLSSDEKSDPIMVLSYKLNDVEKAIVYFFTNDKIEFFNPGKQSKVEFLYNIENEDFNWYLETEENKIKELLPITEIIAGNRTAKYTFKENENKRKEDIFYKVDVPENEVSIENLDNGDALKNAIDNIVKEFKSDEKIITQELKTKVVEEVKKIKEEAEKGVKAGPFSLKYGDYVCNLEYTLGGGIYTINKDGTFSFINEWENYLGERYVDTGEGTYEIKFDEGDDYDSTQAWGIKFTFTKYHSTYEPSNAYPKDYDYMDILANNSFQYRQSPGKFTYKEGGADKTISEKAKQQQNKPATTTTQTANNNTSTKSWLTQFTYDTSVNKTIPTGDYSRQNSGPHTGTLTIKNSTSNSFEFAFDCIYMSQAGYPNIGNLEGTAKATKDGKFVYTEHQDGQYGWDYQIFFTISGEGDNLKITVEDECYKLDGTVFTNPYAGMNVTFEGEYKK